MESKKKITTEQDRANIKLLCDNGVKVSDIARITGFSECTVYDIRAGRWEIKRKKDRIRMAEKQAEKKAREAERREVEQEVMAYIVDNQEPVERFSPFSDERLMMRIADSIDYNNALLNGILNKLSKLVDELA